MFRESRNSVVVQLSWFSVALSAGARRFFSQSNCVAGVEMKCLHRQLALCGVAFWGGEAADLMQVMSWLLHSHWSRVFLASCSPTLAGAN